MKIFNDPPSEERSCGTCSVCCTVMGVKEELNKPNYTNCKHLCSEPEGCCGIYQIRPRPCRDFQCLWRSGQFGDDSCRPDRLGLMAVAFPIQMGNFEYAITIWTTKEEVLDDPKIKYLLRKIAEIRPIIIRSPTTYQIFGRRSEVEAIEKHMKEKNDIEIKETKL
jgi:hypothetical protein